MWHSTPRTYFDVTIQEEEVEEDVFFLAHGGLIPSGVQPAR